MCIKFTSESELVLYIRNHTYEIFGEYIHWDDSLKELPGEGSGNISADLVGVKDNETFIVEVKLLRPWSARIYDLAREAVGQVLHYAYAYVYDQVTTRHRSSSGNPFAVIDPSGKQLRVQLHNTQLFVVGEAFSQPVENICQLLRTYGINIRHLSVNQ